MSIKCKANGNCPEGHRKENNMYGLPHNIKLDFFVNTIFIQMCIGAHDLILNFDNNVSITITSSVACMVPNGNIQKETVFRNIASVLGLLLNHAVVSVNSNEAGTLKLEVDNGGMIEIYDDSKEFESYVIHNGEQIIVV